jgi:hypothetical protein
MRCLGCSKKIFDGYLPVDSDDDEEHDKGVERRDDEAVDDEEVGVGQVERS